MNAPTMKCMLSCLSCTPSSCLSTIYAHYMSNHPPLCSCKSLYIWCIIGRYHVVLLTTFSQLFWNVYNNNISKKMISNRTLSFALRHASRDDGILAYLRFKSCSRIPSDGITKLDGIAVDGGVKIKRKSYHCSVRLNRVKWWVLTLSSCS